MCLSPLFAKDLSCPTDDLEPGILVPALSLNKSYIRARRRYNYGWMETTSDLDHEKSLSWHVIPSSFRTLGYKMIDSLWVRRFVGYIKTYC